MDNKCRKNEYEQLNTLLSFRIELRDICKEGGNRGEIDEGKKGKIKF